MEHNKRFASISGDELQRLAQLYPWWGAAKMVSASRGGNIEDSILLATRLRQRLTPSSSLLKEIDTSELKRSATLGIIDQFLLAEEHRIIIDDQTTDASLAKVESNDEDDEEFLSEELAEIYAKQHLFDAAIEIYEKLSLQDSQKSIYFAELIEDLKSRQSAENNKK